MRRKNSRFPYLLIEKARGKHYYYVRIRSKGSRVRIKSELGTPEFYEQYSEAIKRLTGTTTNTVSINTQSLRWLVTQYMASSAWTHDIADSTRKMRSRLLAHIVDQSGSVPYRSITKANLEAAKELRKNKPNAANNYIKVCRGLFNWACENGYLDKNPTDGLKKFRIKTDGIPIWTDEEIDLYRKSYPFGTKERLLFEIYINTGFRRSDVSNLGKQHIRNGRLNIRCKKNKTDVSIPISNDLRQILASVSSNQLSFMTGQSGKPYTAETLGNYLRKYCRKIGIKKSAHGLRKYISTAFANSGTSERELQAWMGWKSPRQSEVYVRNANNQRMSDSALEKLTLKEQNQDGFALTFEPIALTKNKSK